METLWHKKARLAKACEAARVVNLGKHISSLAKRRMRRTIRKNQIRDGAVFSPYFPTLRIYRARYKGAGQGWTYWDGKRRTSLRHCRLVYQKFHGRIKPGFIVHHIDGDKFNDDPNNLVALSKRAHYALHKFWMAINIWEKREVNGREVFEVWKTYWNSYKRK